MKLTCDFLDKEGKGIIKEKNLRLNNLLPGEVIEYNNRIEKYIKQSPDRVKVKCGVYNDCGGCNLLHYDYNKQLEFKTIQVARFFKNNGIIFHVEDTIGSKRNIKYRNKAFQSYSLSKLKNVTSGMYEEDTHKVINTNNCLLIHDVQNEIFNTIKELMNKYKIKPYNDFIKDGIIRHVMIRVGVKTNEIMVVIITKSDMFPARHEFIKELINKHSNITTIIQNVNPRQTSIVLGEKERVLYGNGYIYDILLGNKYKISSKSFYQVNPYQTEVLYSKAIELAELKKTDTVLDCYSGIGTISLSVAKSVKQVVGVEIVKDAVNDAKTNAKINNINNALFINEDALKFMVNNKQKFDCVFIDPPRRGCDEKFIQALALLEPKKIIYISCGPETQASDIKLLKQIRNYEIKKIQPVDMFPNTHHVECITLLELKK